MSAAPALRRAGLCILLISAAACGPAPGAPTSNPNVLRVTTQLPNGTVTAVLPRDGFHAGGQAQLRLEILCRSGTISGPTRAEVLIASISGANVHVRTLEVAPVTVTGGAQSTVNVAWDQKNDDGRAVASDDFTLALGFDAAPASQQRQAVDVRVTLTVGP
ncbi:MAG: hypothetical protein AUH85_12530 [Chloroflexi bacterium 13_1_40CM_4_68_4]|nr:MAG: hypothetical protein AUH85_12530 [Chloroflexi bacterium 13_1_40CM_4_68_4]